MTCEQQLAEEKQSHKETLERERDNYNKWQSEIDRRKRVEKMLADEVAGHKETIQKLQDTEADRERIVAERNQVYAQIKALVGG